MTSRDNQGRGFGNMSEDERKNAARKGGEHNQGERSSSQHSTGSSNRGFASMDEEKQREIASKGGKAAHEKGTAHEFTSEEAREAGRKGGSH